MEERAGFKLFRDTKRFVSFGYFKILGLRMGFSACFSKLF